MARDARSNFSTCSSSRPPSRASFSPWCRREKTRAKSVDCFPSAVCGAGRSSSPAGVPRQHIKQHAIYGRGAPYGLHPGSHRPISTPTSAPRSRINPVSLCFLPDGSQLRCKCGRHRQTGGCLCSVKTVTTGRAPNKRPPPWSCAAHHRPRQSSRKRGTPRSQRHGADAPPPTVAALHIETHPTPHPRYLDGIAMYSRTLF